ncbi:MAG: DsbA family protein [Nitrospirota bacterium]|nr:DsbA family protein [Nitrospirota bacterium]
MLNRVTRTLARSLATVAALCILFPAAVWAADPSPAPAKPAKPAATSTPATPPAAIAKPDPNLSPYIKLEGRKSTHQKGTIQMTVYFDFFCSHCHQFESTIVPVLRKEYGDKLHINYVGYPIVDAQASPVPILAYYLADAQGKGDAMRDALFSAIWEHRLDVSRPDILLGIAKQVGLDIEVFKRDYNNNAMGQRLEDGKREAKASGVTGTPTVVLDNYIRARDYSLLNVEATIAESMKADR